MKRTILSMAGLATLLLLFPVPIFPQYYIPQPLEIGGAGALVKAFGMSAGDAGRIHPIGWSEDGKFAFLRVVTPQFKGRPIFEYRIFDAVRDEVVWELDDDTEDWPSDDPEMLRGALDIAWERMGETVSAKLREYGIKQNHSTEFSAFPYRRDEELLTAVLTMVSEADPYDGTPMGPAPYPDLIAEYTVTLQSSRRGSKRVTREDEIFAVAAWAEGYIESPYEKRIILLIGEKRMGFEMTPMLEYRFFGSHLGVGFE